MSIVADQLQPTRLKNAAISAAARSGSSRCGKCPTPGNRARSRLEKVAPNRSVQENGNSGSCSAQRTQAGTWIGASRESCRLYIGHFLKAWSHRKHVFDDQLEAFTDNFLKAGNLAGGFAHYRAAHAGRVRMMKGEAPALAPISVPTCVRWAEHDPLFPYEWTDRLGETFTNLDLAMFPDVGHFPHREDPDRAASEITAFFTRIGWL